MVRNLSLFCLSVHDALNIQNPRYKTYLIHSTSPPHQFCRYSAIAGCAWSLAKNLHPARISHFSPPSKFARNAKKGSKENDSFIFGAKIAQAILNSRNDDGSSTTISYIAKTSPGLWRRTPDFYRPPEQPHWRSVTPFGISSVEKFLPPPPPKVSSVTFREALREVKEMGGQKSQIRTQEQTFIARFWKDFSYTQTPPGHWNEIAKFVAKARKLDLWQEARLFALLNLSMADAGIVAWECKYKYHLWRPIHAIRFANQIEATKKLHNPNWQPLLESPAHPEYVSAHGCFSGAAASVLRLTIQSDDFKFRVKSDQFPDTFRSFRSFSSCTKEIGESRLFGGIHYRFSNEMGIKTGNLIGKSNFEGLLENLTK